MRREKMFYLFVAEFTAVNSPSFICEIVLHIKNIYAKDIYSVSNNDISICTNIHIYFYIE